MDQYDDISGKIFGRLTAINRGEDKIWITNGKQRRVVAWNCRCVCGNDVVVAYYDLIKGSVKSCGCLRREKTAINGRGCKTHGYTSQNAEKWKRSLYNIWSGIKQRCHNPNQTGYEYYGGKGITYSKEWEDFESFKEWALENGFKEGLTIDRIDVNGNYEPDNCRWVTWEIQGNNKTDNTRIKIGDENHTISEWGKITGTKKFNIGYRYRSGVHTDEEILTNEYLRDLRKKNISYNGESHSIREWAKIKGLTYSAINWRLKNGWSVESALNTPIKKREQKKIEIDGESHTIEEWSRINNIGITTIYERLQLGWSETDAVKTPPHSGVVHKDTI